MKFPRCLKSRLLSCALLLATILQARADATLVFNEIHYHPATNEPAMEWVELYNQLAVDLDVSGWSLTGDIGYTFPAGTRARGRGVIVVAIDPAVLMAATGATNVLGPFTNRLANGGGTLRLRNNNGRVMDEVNYGVEGEWPVAPDGAGPSLAKIDEDMGSAHPASWRASVQLGGSPGVKNPAGTPTLPVAFNEMSSVTNAQFWVELVNLSTQSVVLDNCVLSRFGNVTNREYILPPQTLPAGGYLVLDRATVGFGADPGDRVILFGPGKTNILDAIVAKSFPRARLPEGKGEWLRPSAPTPASDLYLTILQQLGCPVKSFKESSGPISELLG